MQAHIKIDVDGLEHRLVGGMMELLKGPKLRTVPVLTGAPMGGLVALRDGPPPGTKVVRRPDGELRPGMKVKERQ